MDDIDIITEPLKKKIRRMAKDTSKKMHALLEARETATKHEKVKINKEIQKILGEQNAFGKVLDIFPLFY